jgi:hypothetical protein
MSCLTHVLDSLTAHPHCRTCSIPVNAKSMEAGLPAHLRAVLAVAERAKFTVLRPSAGPNDPAAWLVQAAAAATGGVSGTAFNPGQPATTVLAGLAGSVFRHAFHRGGAQTQSQAGGANLAFTGGGGAAGGWSPSAEGGGGLGVGDLLARTSLRLERQGSRERLLGSPTKIADKGLSGEAAAASQKPPALLLRWASGRLGGGAGASGGGVMGAASGHGGIAAGAVHRNPVPGPTAPLGQLQRSALQAAVTAAAANPWLWKDLPGPGPATGAAAGAAATSAGAPAAAASMAGSGRSSMANWKLLERSKAGSQQCEVAVGAAGLYVTSPDPSSSDKAPLLGSAAPGLGIISSSDPNRDQQGSLGDALMRWGSKVRQAAAAASSSGALGNLTAPRRTGDPLV